MTRACLALHVLFTTAILKGLTLRKCVFDVYVSVFCSFFVFGLILQIGFRFF